MTLLEDAFVLIPLPSDSDFKNFPKKESKESWEWRCFWTAPRNPISVALLSEHIRGWADFEKKERTDIYLWERDHPRNLKVRKNKLHFKPVIEIFEEMTAFGPKEKLKFPLPVSKARSFFPRLPWQALDYKNLEELQGDLQAQGYKVEFLSLRKNIYKIELIPSFELEISLFPFRGQEWRSVCIEGPCYQRIQYLQDLIIPQPGQVMGYTDFFHQKHHV